MWGVLQNAVTTVAVVCLLLLQHTWVIMVILTSASQEASRSKIEVSFWEFVVTFDLTRFSVVLCARDAIIGHVSLYFRKCCSCVVRLSAAGETCGWVSQTWLCLIVGWLWLMRFTSNVFTVCLSVCVHVWGIRRSLFNSQAVKWCFFLLAVETCYRTFPL